MNADKCPHCGSPRTSPLSAYWTCKADTTQRDEDGRTHLCRAREARQKAEKELAELKGRWPENMAIDYLQDYLKDAKSENQKLRELCEMAIDRIDWSESIVNDLRSQLNQLTK